MKIEIKNIDNTKLDLGLRHEYTPDTVLNAGLDEKEKVVIDCEYLRVGERTSLFSMNVGDEDLSMDVYRKLFAKKVKGIRNLEINGKFVTTAEEFLKYPAVTELDALLINVASHILRADDLTEDERKNSSSGSNSGEENTSTKS